MSSQIQIKRLNSGDAGFREILLSSLSLPASDDEAIDAAVVKILAAVKERGDDADSDDGCDGGPAGGLRCLHQ